MTVMRFVVCLVLGMAVLAAAEPIPRIEKVGGKYRLNVNGRPFIVLGAQVRNSSGWSSQLESVWAQMKALHVNTVEIPVYWENIEPRPGEFDFSAVDTIVQQGRERGFRLILLWFGTWKNGVMDYAPGWVKSDPAKYPRMVDAAGQAVRVLSPHAVANREVDRRAFAALMGRLKQTGENYPSGGATTNMLDLWKAVTPAIDAIAPDIYVQHYREYQTVCEKYARADNPLLIPETGGSLNFARYAFYALGDHNAIGFAPFGINQQNATALNESLQPMAATFRLLGPALGEIAALQGTGNLKSAVEEHMLTNRLLTFRGWDVVAMFGFPPQLSYGGLFAPGTKDRTGRALIGQLGDDEFL